jgi:hypothetical protein
MTPAVYVEFPGGAGRYIAPGRKDPTREIPHTHQFDAASPAAGGLRKKDLPPQVAWIPAGG